MKAVSAMTAPHLSYMPVVTVAKLWQRRVGFCYVGFFDKLERWFGLGNWYPVSKGVPSDLDLEDQVTLGEPTCYLCTPKMFQMLEEGESFAGSVISLTSREGEEPRGLEGYEVPEIWDSGLCLDDDDDADSTYAQLDRSMVLCTRQESYEISSEVLLWRRSPEKYSPEGLLRLMIRGELERDHNKLISYRLITSGEAV
jgi:hypothetical protein